MTIDKRVRNIMVRSGDRFRLKPEKSDTTSGHENEVAMWRPNRVIVKGVQRRRSGHDADTSWREVGDTRNASGAESSARKWSLEIVLRRLSFLKSRLTDGSLT
ncbi:hypothetical protein EVAR_14263_1 [Eumeta japonica]|uniref:Uncharacterized protein n=1 Tax=Eumeta variegata TaxID=151549 RepID=A0A4C1W9M2_EUMVA|nr:hypothetical protein EVAR_14263_1 [Eumeta japonica]